jgi:hypothetical protein
VSEGTKDRTAADMQIADIMSLFALLHQSLHNGKALPPMMSIFERLGYHSMHQGSSGSRTRASQSRSDAKDEGASSGSGTTLERSRTDVEEERVVKDLSKEMTLEMAKVSSPPPLILRED